MPPACPTSRRPPLHLLPIGPLLLGLTSAAGCTTPRDAAVPDPADGVPSVSSLQRAASSAANGGNVNVQLIDGVAYVTGRVDSALEENAIKRVLRKIDGVERVETSLQRNM